MRKRLFILSFTLSVLFIEASTFAGVGNKDVVITGEAPSYAGDELIFYKYSDYISFTEQELCRSKVNADGSFICPFFTDEIIRVHIYIGAYKGYLFVEPGAMIKLKLPGKVSKTPQQLLSPFFEETELFLGVINENKNGINYQIQLFDNVFNQYFYRPVIKEGSLENQRENFKEELERRLDNGTFVLNADYYISNAALGEEGKLDSIIDLIEGQAECYDNEFFRTYKKYRLALLKYSSTHYKSKNISATYFLDQKTYYNNPAYMELFDKLYDRYFLFFGRTKQGEKIYEDIGKYKSYTRLKETLGQDNVLTNDTLKELVILKGLHDGFYTSDFSRLALLEILDSLQEQTLVPEHKLIALKIREKVTKLLQGFTPPYFELFNSDSVLVRLDDFKGKYVYLNFCLCLSYTCLQEFAMISNLNKTYGDKLEIVTILADEDYKQALNYLKKNNYNWKFLHFGNQPKVLEEYDIRAFPTYYLIGPDGKLRLSPAPPPGENIELKLFQIMKTDHYL